MTDLTRSSINSMSRPNQPHPGRMNPQMAAGQMGGMTPKEIIAIFQRHILMIVCFTFFGLVLGGVSWFLALRFIPKYTAVTYIQVESPERQNPLQIETRTANKDTLYQFRVSMASLMKQESLFAELLKLERVRDTKWYKSLDNKYVDGIKELKDNFGASPQRESQFITASMRTSSAGESAEILNAVVDLFVNSQSETSKNEIRNKLTNLQAQEDKLRSDLKTANDALDEWRARSGFTGLAMDDEFEHTLSRKEQQIVLQLDNLETDISETEEQIRTFQARLESVGVDPVTQAQTEQDPIVLNLKQQKAQLTALVDEKQANLGENHRTVRELKQRVNQIEQQMIERYQEIARVNRQSILTSAQDQMRALENQRQTLIKKQQEAQTQLQGMERAKAEYDRRLVTRDQLKDSLEEMGKQIEQFQALLDDPETPKVRKVGNARPPLAPSFPKWQVFFPGGFILGFMAGAGLAFLVEFMNDKLRTPKEISTNISLPLLGMICDTGEDKEIKAISDPSRTIIEAPYSISSEFYRQLRTNLDKNLAETQKVLLVTSGSGGEGRTSIAANLAASFVAKNEKVIFVDTNFRRPSSLKIFPKSSSDMPSGTQQVQGLSNYLENGGNISDIIRHCNKSGVDVIDAGPLPGNPAELLESSNMDNLLRQLSTSYDHVIIDGPPLLVSDAKILAIKSDACLLVFNATKTKKGAAMRSVRELREINANVVGCSLVGVKSLKGGYFNEMFKSYRDYSKAQLATSAK